MESLAKRLLFVILASLAVLLINVLQAAAQQTRKTVASGSFNTKSTWDCNCIPAATDNILITTGRVVTLVANTNMRDLTIQFGGTLNDNGKTTTVTGNLIVQGSYSATGDLALTGLNTNIDWVGLTSNSTNILISGNKTISAGAVLSKSGGNIVLDQNTIVTNNGTLSLGGSITSSHASARWINAAGSSLTVGGSILNSNGELDASAMGNTIIYNSSSPVNIKAPVGGQYHNLTFQGSEMKVLPNAEIFIRGSFYNGSPINPSSGTVIFNGMTSMMGTVSPVFHNLVVADFAAVIGFPDAMYISGDFTVDGSFYASGGEFVFNGTTAPQYIRGISPITSFETLHAANTLGVYNEKSIEIYDGLNVSPGATFYANGSGGGKTILKSLYEFTDDDAHVGPLLGGAKVSGRVQVERHVTPVARIYRYLSSPVKSATVRDWSDDFLITGNIPGLKKTTLCGFSITPTSTSLYYYRESDPGASANGYVPYPENTAQGLNAPLIPGRGYAAYIRNCNSLTINVEGELNAGDINFDFITWTPSGNSADGYNLVGNPYASAIDWASESGWTRSNVSSVIALTNNKSGLTQFIYLDALETSEPQVISSGQAFWLQATGADPQLIIHEEAKALGGGEFFRNRSSDQLIISLADGNVTDKAYVKLRSFASPGRDNYDGLKWKNATIDIFTIAEDDVEMAINSTPTLPCSSPIRIGMRNVKPGAYSLSVEKLGRFESFSYVLRDAYLNKTIELDKPYNFEVNSDPASAAVERFSLQAKETGDVMLSLNNNRDVCGGDALITFSNAISGSTYNLYNKADFLVASVTAPGSSFDLLVKSDALKPGDNKFVVADKSGCLKENTATISVYNAIVPEDFIVGHVQQCAGNPAQLSVEGVDASLKVLWYESAHATKSVYEGPVFETPALYKSASWFVKLQNDHGCTTAPREAKVNILQPASPTLTQQGAMLLSSDESTTWYLNDEVVGSGAELVVSREGTYEAEVRNGSCVLRESMTVIIAAIELTEMKVSLYPNPAQDFIILSGNLVSQITLVDMSGRAKQIIATSYSDSKSKFDIGEIRPGAYVIKYFVGGIEYTTRLVKR